MKRKIATLLVMVLVILSLSGCSFEQQSYLKELSDLSKWEAYQFKISVGLQGEALELAGIMGGQGKYNESINVEGYINVTDESGQLRVSMEGDLSDETPDLEVFFDEGTIYIDKNVLVEQSRYNYFDKIDADYIGYPVTDELEALPIVKKAQDYEQSFQEILKDITIRMPLKQEGRTYTMQINHDNVGEMASDYAKGLYAHMEELTTLYLEIIKETQDLKENVKALDDEELDQLTYEEWIAYYRDYYESAVYYEEKIKETKEEAQRLLADGEVFEMIKYFVQGALYGSTLDMKTTFTDTSMTGSFKGRLQFLKAYSTNYDISVKLEKAEPKKVTLPKKVKKLTKEQFDRYEYVGHTNIDIREPYGNTTFKEIEKVFSTDGANWDIEGFKVEDTYYVSVKELARSLDYILEYDAEKKQYYFMDNSWYYDEEMLEAYNELYDQIYEEEDKLYTLYYEDQLTYDEVEEKIEALYDNIFIEKTGGEIYLNVKEIGGMPYISLANLEKAGFESKVFVDSENLYDNYICVFYNWEDWIKPYQLIRDQ